ncbi:leucine-rich repeat protein [Ruminococcus sp.]|uniref:leucine-rich repeat protein n=1 Tax=Ruminococcus sp. TaxID=41978 RepID=UPI0025D63845|nr:leucine-rich repeat protein [Ruminococcus sp.]
MKKILATLLAVSLTFGSVALPAAESGVNFFGFGISASAEEDTSSFTYSLNEDDTARLTKYTGSAEKVNVPAEIDGHKVTSIGYAAFRNCGTIKELIIPSSVEELGDWLFSSSSTLEKVVMEEGVKSIGSNAFANCTALSDITIPKSVTSIDTGAFTNTQWLKNKLAEDPLVIINTILYNGGNCTGDLVIPDYVTTISPNAFVSPTSYMASSITSVTIPDSVTSIGQQAFEHCKSLKTVNVGKNVSDIGANAFYDTEWISDKRSENHLVVVNGILIDAYAATGDVTIPEGVTKICDYAFSSNLAPRETLSVTSVTFPDSVKEFGKWIVNGNKNITSISISANAEVIPTYAFYNYNGAFEEITFRGTCAQLMTYFNSASDFHNIFGDIDIKNVACTDGTIGDFLYNDLEDGTIAIRAYMGSDTDIKIPETVNGKTVTAIAPNAFAYFEADSIELPESVTTISDYSFFASNIKTFKMGGNVKSIGEGAFMYCGNLESIELSATLENIGNWAFGNCTALSGVPLPETLKDVGVGAFVCCGSLNSITIPKSVENIGAYAFGFYDDGDEIYKKQDNFKLTVYYQTAGEEYAQSSELECEVLGKPAHTHSYTSTITKQPTCTAEGVKTFTCECGDTYTESIPAKGHTLEWVVISSSGSGCTYSKTEAYKCTICGAETEYRKSAIKGHTEVIDPAVPATCTKAGKTEGSHCSVCGEVIKAQIEIKATGHKSSGWITDKAAAIGVKGKKHKECTVCKTVLETADIPALAKQSISKASVTLSTSTYAYDGKAKKPSVTVKLNGKTLKNGTDYTVSYSNNTKVGTAKVTITGKSNYTGTISKTFSIKNDFTKASVSGISNKTFTGKAQTQKITVKFGGKTLKSGTDYTISYSNNTKVGKATVKIVGKGNYTGTITKTFKINPAKQTINKLTAKSKGFTASWSKKDHATGYEIQYSTDSKFKSVSKATITSKSTTSKSFTKLKASKKYYVRMRIYTTVNGTKYYGAWSATKTITTKK